MTTRIDKSKFKVRSRRELLKLTPMIALGAFAIPRLQEPLLKTGLGFSDWASRLLFRSGHMATTFSDSELTPFNKFPINDYDVDDPGVDFDRWTLSVTGAVQKPGDYTLAQIQALPRFRQNTRHVCRATRLLSERLPEISRHVANEPVHRYLSDAEAGDRVHGLSHSAERRLVNPGEIQLRFR
jgi:hypothetical protein